MFSGLCSRLHFSQEMTAALLKGYHRIRADAACAERMKLAAQAFTTEEGDNPELLMYKIAEQTGIHYATVVAITLIHGVALLKENYRKAGVPEEIMWDTLIDLRCKLQEMWDREGVWGVSVVSWYQRLFTLKIVKLGRLEFEPISYRWDTPYGEIQRGDPVVFIHIPSCGSISIEAVMDSLKRAYAFFKDRHRNGIPFVCNSWLLYPPMYDAVFPKGSNLSRFYECFDIIEQQADKDNKDFWRIFKVFYSRDALQTAPADNTLRRNLLAFMRDGNNMGMGRGAFWFDGENIIKK